MWCVSRAFLCSILARGVESRMLILIQLVSSKRT
ncbi:unnamed protein product [Rhodiola kirilowii]